MGCLGKFKVYLGGEDKIKLILFDWPETIMV